MRPFVDSASTVGSHADSSPCPLTISRSARLRSTEKLRFGRIPWGSCEPLTRNVTETCSPPTIRARAAWVSVVATIWSFASAGAAAKASSPDRSRKAVGRRVILRGPRRLERRDELSVDLVEEVGHRLDAQVFAHGARQYQRLGSGLSGDLVDDRATLVGLGQDHLDAAPLHAIDQRSHVGSTGRQGFLRLDVVENLQAVTAEQIVPAPVIADDLHPAKRFHELVPFLEMLAEVRGEALVVAPIIRGVGQVDLRQLVRDVARDDRGVARVE